MRLHSFILIFAGIAAAHAAESPVLVTGGLTNVAGASDSFIEAITPDGRWAVMVSHANNLTTNDDLQPYSDIFVRDLQAGRTLLVTVSMSGSGGGNGNSQYGWISPDGRYVIFASEASNLIPNDTNGVSDVFRRDLQTGAIELVSVARSGGVASTSANRSTTGASRPVVTPDGRWVAFESASTEFVEGDTNPTGKIFVRDLQAGITRLATEGAEYSRLGSITDDGRFIAFIAQSAASMPGRTNAGGDVFISDLQMGQQFWASTNLPSPLVPAYRCHTPVASSDGRTVWFNATVSGTTYVLEHDFTTGETKIPETVPPEVWRKMNSGVGPLITADGRIEFFDSAAALVANDNNGSHDVFRRYVQSGATDLVSVAEPLRPSRSAMRSVAFDRYMVDATATRIAFVSPDVPGIPGDTNTFPDNFVKDVTTGALYSFPTQYDGFYAQIFSANMQAVDPQISADGVALTFVRQNLSNGIPATSDLVWQVVGFGPGLVVTNVGTAPPAISSNGQAIVYRHGSPFYTWHDLATGLKTTIMGVYPEEVDPYRPQLPPVRPVISGDRRWLAFRRSAHGVVIYNVQSNSVDSYPTPFDVSASQGGDLALSADSRFLFFEGSPAYTVYRRDLQSRQTDLICNNCMNPSPSADGNIVAYHLSPQGAPQDIIVNDLRTGIPQVITTGFTPTNASSRRFSAPSISADGRYVVFSTTLTNTSAGDFNSQSDVYVYDRVQRSTLLISRSRLGDGPAAGGSSNPVLARDGRSVVFQSFANDLVDGDYNYERDIFVLKLGVGDSDNDGMDDDWEVAHFGDLNRDGAGDQDGDGHSNLQEFIAGTNPTSGGSILRVLTITPMGGGSTTVVWSAVVGRNYVVQFKNSLDATWSNASGAIEADGTSMSFAHNSSSPQRFYRVIAVQ
jgi:Tol biopolymer transport system component